MSLAEDILDALVETYAAREADFEEWDLDALKREVGRVFAIDTAALDFSDRTSDEIREALWERITASYDEKEKLVGRDVLQRVERDIMLQIVDAQWKDHLYSLDHLKEGIGLRGYGQRDPLVEYKKESFGLFQAMKERVDEEIVRVPLVAAPGAVATKAARRRRRAVRRPAVAAHPQRPERARAPSAPSAARRPRAGVSALGAPATAARPRRRRRRRGEDRPARRAEGGPQRSVPVRQRQEVQEVPRRRGVASKSTVDRSRQSQVIDRQREFESEAADRPSTLTVTDDRDDPDLCRDIKTEADLLDRSDG